MAATSHRETRFLPVVVRRIESEEDTKYLLQAVLLKRYSIVVDNQPTQPANVIERACDFHALRIIGSAGYQKCVSYLWKGWLVQDDDDPSNFVDWKDRDNPSFLAHLDPDRMRVPMYQNLCQLLISLAYLGLYTGAINTINRDGDLDFVEGLLYAFTIGFLFDEISKLWKAGHHILGFWNIFNWVLYAFMMISLALRIVAFSKHPSLDSDAQDERERFNELSYNFLAISAPMFWTRLLLYLDTFRFFGAMLVVLKVMMRESVIFFALLIVIVIGFLQSFIGLDYAEDHVIGDSTFIMQAMANALMQSPDFTGFEKFGHPFGIILYYCFTFIVMVSLFRQSAISSWAFDLQAMMAVRRLTWMTRLCFSTSSLPCTTRHMRTFTRMRTRSSLLSFRRRRCSSYALLTRTSSYRHST